MPGSSTKTQWQKPVIRKLICQDDCFTCSLCRSNYDNRHEAMACLHSCWEELGRQHPVHIRRQLGQKPLFRCQYCSRDYMMESEALSCADQCRARINALHTRELRAYQIVPRGRPRRPKRPDMHAVVALAGPPLSPFRSRTAAPPAPANHLTAAEEIASANQESEVETSSPSNSAAPLEGKATPSKGRSKRSFAKAWVRHDAKYKCSYCNALYFTKMETEQCFEGHFDAEGFEINAA